MEGKELAGKQRQFREWRVLVWTDWILIMGLQYNDITHQQFSGQTLVIIMIIIIIMFMIIIIIIIMAYWAPINTFHSNFWLTHTGCSQHA